MTAQPNEIFVTVEEYLRLDRQSTDFRYEYLDGQIQMMSGGTSDHSQICVNVIVALRQALAGGPCRVHTSDMRVQLSPTRYVYPDVSVTCHADDLGRSDMMRSPKVVFEVLSPIRHKATGTRSARRSTKRHNGRPWWRSLCCALNLAP